jgi:hypothetical protein
LRKEVREELIKEEEQKKIQDRIKRELEDQLPIWIKKGYEKDKIISSRKDLIKNILESEKNPKLKHHEEVFSKEKFNTEISHQPITTNDLNMKTENIYDGPSSYDRRINKENTKINIQNKNSPNISKEKEKISLEKQRIVNPFVENLENQARINVKKTNKNKLFTEESNVSHDANEKVIYTNKGWGILDYKKFQARLSGGIVKRSNDPKISSKNNRYEKVNDKSDNNNVGNIMNKLKNVKRISDFGNQKIIYTEKSKINKTADLKNIDNNNLVKHNRKKSQDFWIGSKFDESDENGEWSEN